jgi:hypothetical protein
MTLGLHTDHTPDGLEQCISPLEKGTCNPDLHANPGSRDLGQSVATIIMNPDIEPEGLGQCISPG